MGDIINKLIEDESIVEINGDKYIVDIKANYVELQEYKLFQRIILNFKELNKHPLFKWTFYIRALIFIIAGFFVIRNMIFPLIKIVILTLLAFFILNYLGWNGTWGYLLFLAIILIDVVLGIIEGNNGDFEYDY